MSSGGNFPSSPLEITLVPCVSIFISLLQVLPGASFHERHFSLSIRASVFVHVLTHTRVSIILFVCSVDVHEYMCYLHAHVLMCVHMDASCQCPVFFSVAQLFPILIFIYIYMFIFGFPSQGFSVYYWLS